MEEGGLWGLVIIISAFMIQVFTFGTSSSIGVYNMELLNDFDNDVTGVSLLTSVNIACFLGGGLLANWFAAKYSHRSVALVGAAGMLVGLFVMPWMTSLRAMIPFYGGLVGMGCCFAYAPSHTLSGLYYNKYRSLATGLATSGSGLGAAVFPPLIRVLIDEYAWRGSLIFLAGLNLHVFIFAMLLRPPPPLQCAPLDVQDSGDEQSMQKPMQIHDEVQVVKSQRSLFYNFGFDNYFVSNILWNAGSAIFLAFGPEFFIVVGLSKMEASFMLTLFGLGQFVGAVIGGIVGNIPQFNRIYIYIVTCVVGGMMLFLLPLVSGFAAIGTLSILYGLCFGILLGLLIIVMTDLIGTDNIGMGLGIILVANGIGAFIGPPIAGLLEENFGGYEYGLYFSGIATVIAGLMTFLIPLQVKFCGGADDKAVGPMDSVPEEGSPIASPRSKFRKRLSDVAEERGRRSLIRQLSSVSGKSLEFTPNPNHDIKLKTGVAHDGHTNESTPFYPRDIG